MNLVMILLTTRKGLLISFNSFSERSVPQSETLARATGHRAQHHFDGGTHGYQRQSEEPKHRQSRLEQNKSSHAKSDSGEVISNESESIGVDQLVSISTPQLSLHADSDTLSRSSSGYTDRYRAPEVSPTAVGAAMEGVGVGARCFMGMRETTVGELRRQHLADYADVMDCLVGCDVEVSRSLCTSYFLHVCTMFPSCLLLTVFGKYGASCMYTC